MAHGGMDPGNLNDPLPPIDPDFPPELRGRSNTWPVQHSDDNDNKPTGGGKKSSRKNAWGPQSYAELITMAINSTVDKRLTLSQIYDWLVTNIPHFRDKGENNSSAGWKVRAIYYYY